MHLPLHNGLRLIDLLIKGDPLPLIISRTAALELRAEIYSIYHQYFISKYEDDKRKSVMPTDKEIF
jgi:hypothetical protein